ncbi:hypothetical protein [Streptomyces sodiiphilus]
MRAKTLAARWRGENAEVSRAFILTAANRFAAAHSQAQSMHNILRDLHDTLEAQKRRLHELAEEARGHGLYIQRDGTVIPQEQGPYAPDYLETSPQNRPQPAWAGRLPAREPSGNPEAAEAIVVRMREILLAAETADSDHARALMHLAGEDEDHFTGHSFDGIDDARDALGSGASMAAADVIDLIESGQHLTDAGLADLCDYVHQWSHDPDFSEALALGMGPEGTLAFWGELMDARRSQGASPERVEMLGDLHEHLGTTLGLATRSDSAAMSVWKEEIIGLGARRDPSVQGGPYGFQVMSSLMLHGEWDGRFLQDYGAGLVSVEREWDEVGTLWGDPASLRLGDPYGPDAFLALDQGKFPHDPVTGFMAALSRDPEAATSFFSARHPEDFADYFLLSRELGELTYEQAESGGLASRHAVGEALYAATTGLSPADSLGENRVEPGPEHRELFERTLSLLAPSGKDFPPELREPVARVLAYRGEEVFDSISVLNPRSSELEYYELKDVMVQVSRDPIAYRILNEGVNLEILERVRDPDQGELGDPAKNGPEKSLREAGASVGFLEQVRYEALEQNEKDPTWTKHGFYHGIGSVVTFVPTWGDIIQRGVDMLTTAWLDEEVARRDEERSDQHTVEFDARRGQLDAIVKEWSKSHLGWQEGEEILREWQSVISADALLGNAAARKEKM